MNSIILLYVLTTLTLTILFIYIYLKYRTLQYERIYTDALTHLLNRSYLTNQFVKKIHTSKSHYPYLATIMTDIDLFKKINDTFGHTIGDQVLCEIGECFHQIFEKDLCIRYGGEEILVGLWISDKEYLEDKIKQLQKMIHEKKFSTMMVNVSLSIGASYELAHEASGWLIDELIKEADENLYYVKNNGRDNFKITEITKENK